jgi:hypothetical protein
VSCPLSSLPPIGAGVTGMLASSSASAYDALCEQCVDQNGPAEPILSGVTVEPVSAPPAASLSRFDGDLMFDDEVPWLLLAVERSILWCRGLRSLLYCPVTTIEPHRE